MKQFVQDSDFVFLKREPLLSELTDNELVARVKAEDDSAYEELFKRHRRRVALIASRFFHQPQQIEDILQESFTKAYFGIGELAIKHETSFGAWIARIAFNCCYDELRRAKRHPESVFSEISEEEAAWLTERLQTAKTDDIEHKTVFRDLAEKLLARLSPEDRLILVLLEIEEMPIAEIGKLTKWSTSKIKVRAHRARAALRRIVKRFL